MDTDMTSFAELLANLIAKYADRIDLEGLPDPPSSQKSTDQISDQSHS